MGFFCFLPSVDNRVMGVGYWVYTYVGILVMNGILYGICCELNSFVPIRFDIFFLETDFGSYV